MFITKKHISRRTVLRGMGAAVALPFLESMVPAQTPLRKTAASPKSRLTCIEVCHGSAGSTDYGEEKNLWMPAKEGADFEFANVALPALTDIVIANNAKVMREAEKRERNRRASH